MLPCCGRRVPNQVLTLGDADGTLPEGTSYSHMDDSRGNGSFSSEDPKTDPRAPRLNDAWQSRAWGRLPPGPT